MPSVTYFYGGSSYLAWIFHNPKKGLQSPNNVLSSCWVCHRQVELLPGRVDEERPLPTICVKCAKKVYFSS